MRARRTAVALVGLLACLALAGAAQAKHGAQPRGIALDALLALTTHEGRQLSREDLKGRPLAVLFGFTHCPAICPTMLLEWSQVLHTLGPDGDRLRVLFVSVDSERDTPAVLQQYLSDFDARIVGLTGSTVEVAAVAHAFGAFYEQVAAAGTGATFDHTTRGYLVDRYGLLAAVVGLQGDDRHRKDMLGRLLAQ